MKFYIIEDDLSIIKVLENIIEDNNLGEITGYCLNGEDCTKDMFIKRPDIILVDLLMPGKDGIKVTNEIKKINSGIKVIMISQVDSKDMICKAYNSGIEFFINKPINVIEVTTVIKKVIEKINMQKTLNTIRSMINIPIKNNKMTEHNTKIKVIRLTLSKLGIGGESGEKDLINISKYLIENNINPIDIKIKDICTVVGDKPKAMEQRIRRAVKKAMSNIASIGIEDYMNENFVYYSNTLFNFEDIKSEMDYLRGKRKSGGKVSVKKFIEGLILHCEIQ